MRVCVHVRVLTLPSVDGSQRPSRGVRQQASRLVGQQSKSAVDTKKEGG